MTAANEVANLLMEIRREVCRSVSILILKVLDRNFQTPEDIASIQNLQEAVLRELYHLNKSLDHEVSIVEKTELIKNILKYKLYEIRFECRKEMDSLEKQRDALIRTIPIVGEEDPTLSIKIKKVSDMLNNIEIAHMKSLDFMKEQKLQAEKAYEQAVLTMNNNLEKLSKGFDILLVLIEAEKSALSRSEVELITTKYCQEIAEFKSAIERFRELKATGWKIIYPEEKIVDMLQERGLKVLRTGELITEVGQQITFREARDSKLLEDISPNILKEIRTHLKDTSDNDSFSSRSTISIHSGSEKCTSVDQISSEDVRYLRDRLGKALSLALYEVATLQPTDPIQYLSHWLFKYRYNPQIEDPKSDEFEILNIQSIRLAEEKAKRRVTDDVRATVLEILDKAQNIACMHAFTRKMAEI